MIFATSFFYESPPAIIESIESAEVQILINYGLSTAEGRSHFLEHKLLPFIMNVDQLVIEVQTLSQTISEKNGENSEDQNEILALSDQLNAKMETMSSFLPILEMTLMLESDFESLDQIINKTSPLDPFEKEILKRIASLCEALY